MILLPILIGVLFLAIIITNARNAKNNKQNFEIESNQTQYNTATGLSMIGALDGLGSAIGTSASDRDNYWNNNYLNSQAFRLYKNVHFG